MSSMANGQAHPASEKQNRAVVGGTLTPWQRHYLLKVLVEAEMHDEWSLLDEEGGLKQYGAPFLTKAEQAPKYVGKQHERHPEHTHQPVILLHLFHTHLRRFPGLDAAKESYWQTLIAPFFDKVAKAHFSNSAERSELTNRKVLNITATRYFSTFFARGVGIRGPGELRGPGKGEEGSEVWGTGKRWGRGTVKRGLDAPVRPDEDDVRAIDCLFDDNDDRSQEAKALWRTGKANTQRVKRDWSAWKESIIESEGGLDETLEQLHIKFMSNLPDRYRNAAEWVRRHVAFVAWTVLVKYPGGDEIFGIIKTIHFLFPYWGAKQLLKIANAQKMIKAIIDLVLARPLGAFDSLGQRIFFTIMRGEIGKIKTTILAPLRASIGDAKACKSLDEYAEKRTSEERSALLKKAQERGTDDVLVLILEAYGYEDVAHVAQWQQEYVNSVLFTNVNWAYPDECRKAKYLDDLPMSVRQRIQAASPQARKFAQLKLYLREALRKRDRVQVLAIGSGPLVPSVIRQSLEIVFYKLLYDIALASNLSARLQDLQNFVDDLIQVKQQKRDSLEDYVALAARHEANLYMFVHEIRDAVKPVFDWCQAALDFMALSTTDPWNAGNAKASKVEVNLDAMLARANASGQVNVASIVKELQGIEQFSRWDKIKTELAMRKEYALIHDDAITNVTLCQWSKGGQQRGQQTDDQRIRPTASTRARLEDVDGLLVELLRQTDVEPDKGTISSNEAWGTDAAQVPWANFTPDDVLCQRYAERLSTEDERIRSYHVDSVHVALPKASRIRTLLPFFRDELAKCLPDWLRKATGAPPGSSAK